MTAGRIHVVVGGQFGSEAKGHVADQIHRRHKIEAAVRVGGPNAGHTVIDKNGVRFPLRTIPVAAATDHNTWLVISAGSEVEIPVLFHEIDLLEQAGHPVRNRLMIDREATVIEQRHIDQEKQRALHENIGSTGKGIGAARADRMMRGAKVAREFPELWDYLGDTQSFLNRMHQADGDILIEGTQGYHLGMTAGHYPRSTTNNCRAIDCISQAGVTPLRLPDTWLVFRTYPIRVAGNSGPMENEIDWEILEAQSEGYIQPERTTVTQKVRRVAEWSPDRAKQAIEGNGGPNHPSLHCTLMFIDYFDSTIAGTVDLDRVMHSRAWSDITAIEADLGVEFAMFGTGPDTVVWR